MTTLEAKATAIAKVLVETEPETWGKAQADAASGHLKKLFAQGEIDADAYAEAVQVCSGNHSAMRQVLEKHGLMKGNAAKPALVVEIEKQSERIAAEINAAVVGKAKGVAK